MTTSPSSWPQVVRFGAFEADFRSGELRNQGIRIKLQEQPLQILAMLLEHPGQVVTREELRRKVWPADTFVDFDHGLNKAINKLREALGDSADNPHFIETLAKRGYRFAAGRVQTVHTRKGTQGQSCRRPLRHNIRQNTQLFRLATRVWRRAERRQQLGWFAISPKSKKRRFWPRRLWTGTV